MVKTGATGVAITTAAATWLLAEPEGGYKYRTIKGEKQVYVGFLGMPANYDRWLPASDVTQLKK